MQSVLRAPQLIAQGFRHGFSTRLGGVSTGPFASLNLGGSGDDPSLVAENQRLFASWVGYEPERLFVVSQVHGARVWTVNAASDPAAVRLTEADGLVSRTSAIGIRTADCVPILLADPESRTVAALHAGWRGLVAGVIGAGVRALSVPPERLVAAVFPHIGGCCFEVSEEVATALHGSAPDAGEPGHRNARGKPHVALDRITLAQLTAAGVVSERIDVVSGCTRCDATQFFSHRRDGIPRGTHLAVIVAG